MKRRSLDVQNEIKVIQRVILFGTSLKPFDRFWGRPFGLGDPNLEVLVPTGNYLQTKDHMALYGTGIMSKKKTGHILTYRLARNNFDDMPDIIVV